MKKKPTMMLKVKRSRFKHIADCLRDARLAADLSQKDVSDHLGYTSTQFVSNWERGLCSPPLTSLKRLCKLYNLDPEKIFNIFLKDVEADMRREFQNAGHG